MPAGPQRPACQGQVCLTCLRLASGQRPVSRVCLKLHQLLWCPSPSVRLRKQLSPDLLLARPSSAQSETGSLRLASGPVPQPACWRVLRVCDWPQAQPATCLAHPATRPSSSSVVRQPATHPWLCSLGSAQRGRSGLSNVSETGDWSQATPAQAAQPRLARP